MFFCTFLFFIHYIAIYSIDLPPKKGSFGLGTLLTVTGTGFISENASIFVGKAACHIEQITSK